MGASAPSLIKEGMMKVKMLKDTRGSNNGIEVVNFKQGVIYDTDKGEISDSLVNVFIGCGYAEKVKEAPFTVTEKVSYEKKVVKPKENKKKK